MKMNYKHVAVTVFVLLVALIWFIAAAKPVAGELDMASSTIRVEVGQAHGSAVHIGNGFYITAGHVVDGVKPLQVVNDKGGVADARRVWGNFLGKTEGGMDIALIKVSNGIFNKRVETASIDCEMPEPGTPIIARGNPLSLKFISTHGYTAGSIAYPQPPWIHVIPIDVAGGAGMSGGGVFREDTGALIGIVVAGIGQVSPLMLAVPTNGGVCDMLARVE